MSDHDTEAARLLDRLLLDGFVVRGGDGDLFVLPRSQLTEAQAAAIAEHKAALLKLLAADQGGDIVLVLRPLADAYLPMIIRLRRLLKLALRGLGFRALRVEQLPVPDTKESEPPCPEQPKPRRPRKTA